MGWIGLWAERGWLIHYNALEEENNGGNSQNQRGVQQMRKQELKETLINGFTLSQAIEIIDSVVEKGYGEYEDHVPASPGWHKELAARLQEGFATEIRQFRRQEKAREFWAKRKIRRINKEKAALSAAWEILLKPPRHPNCRPGLIRSEKFT